MPAAFEQMEVAQVATALHSTLHGLSSSEAAVRLHRYGPNRLTAHAQRSWVRVLLGQFTDLFSVLLVGAAALNLVIGGLRDALILITIVLVNAAIGFFQEFRAEKVLKSLQRLLAPKARVLRDGEAREVDADNLVPGDVVMLEEGDAVPADLRLIEEHNLLANDFSLTGEADPKNKFIHALPAPVDLPERDNEVFFGTTVARGNGQGIVIATGMQTQIGLIAKLSAETREDASPLQSEMGVLARRLTVVAFTIGGLFFLLSLSLLNILSAVTLAIGIAAAMVPQGLPAQVSVALTLGVRRLARRNALVKKLSAVETLGSTTVICTDKTGTITAGQMTITRVWTPVVAYDVSGAGYEPEGTITVNQGRHDQAALEALLAIGPLASTAMVRPPDEAHGGWYCLGDPTEGALVTLARKGGIDPEDLDQQTPELKQFPFDSVRKRMSSVRQLPEGLRVFVKGAPERVLERCVKIRAGGKDLPLTEEHRSAIQRFIADAAGEGLRVLALAARAVAEAPGTIDAAECELTFVGLVAMADPPRPGVDAAFRATHTAGIRTFVLTGDAAVTARAIAMKVGIGNGDLPVIEGGTLLGMADTALAEILSKPAAVFCRVSPENKLRIVEMLKSKGEVVAVTGDGVNDAPALKAAAIGVAMGKTGTDVSKDASEVILLDDAYTTLVDAVREGRTIFQNLRKTIRSTLTSNGGELFTTLFGFGLMALGLQQPLLAVQILAIDLFGEMAPLALLTLDPPHPRTMQEKPRARTEHLVSFADISRIAGWGALMGVIGVLGYLAYLWAHRGVGFAPLEGGSLLHAQATTVTYLTIIACQYANILSRRWDESIFHRQTLANTPLLLSIVLMPVLIAGMIVSPIGAALSFAWPGALGWGIAGLGGLVFLGVWELVKLGYRRRANDSGRVSAMRNR